MKRVAVTGSTGYLGRGLVRHLRQSRGGVEIMGIDVRQPEAGPGMPDAFVRTDVLAPQLHEALRGFAPDTIVHAAFSLTPLRDRARMRRNNVEGCRNVLDAADACPGLRRFMLVSSATAYGARSDNPLPIDERRPLRPSRFQYAADKVAVEELVRQYAERRPDVAVSQVRPAIIGGAGMDNYISRFLFGLSVLVLIDGGDTPLQFVHEEDVVSAMAAILAADGRGAFNIAPNDWTPISQIARETGRRVIRLPYWLVRGVHGLRWALRWPGHESPAEFLEFVRYPWAVAPCRLTGELGFTFRYSSVETLREAVRHRAYRRALARQDA